MTASMIGCPSCAGVLAEVSHPHSSYVSLECTLGHTFSLESALHAKEKQMEQALWTAVVVANHLDMVTTKLLGQPDSDSFTHRRQELERRRAQARDHAVRLRAMMEEAVRPDMSPDQTGPRELGSIS